MRAETGGCGVTTSSLVLTLVGAFFEGLTDAALVAAAGLGVGFLGLAVFLVAVTFGCSEPPETGWRWHGSWSGGFDNSPLPTTWLNSSPRSICPAQESTCLAFRAAELLLALLLRLCTGARLQKHSLLTTTHSHGSSLWLLPQLKHWGSVYIAVGPLVPRTSPPIADRKAG